MSEVTKVQKNNLERLQKNKDYSRMAYDELIQKIQQPKMKELWDDPEDEAWEDT